MAKTATREIHRDSEPLFTGTHKLANVMPPRLLTEDGGYLLSEDGTILTLEGGDYSPSSYLYDKGACFRSLGVDPDLGQYVENETQGTSGTVTAATEDTVTVSGVEWYYGDTYSIYRTSQKDGFISAVWTDVSRGFKIDHPDDINNQGWRTEDWDIDDKGRVDIFGPGQPQRS